MDDTKHINDSMNQSIRELVGKQVKIGIKKLIRQEIKAEKYENRIICSCDFKIYLISLNKSQKPQKVLEILVQKLDNILEFLSIKNNIQIEGNFNFLEIKKFESMNKNQLLITTSENREYKLSSDESSNELDEFVLYFCKTLRHIFPSISIKDLFECVLIQPEKRWSTIETIYEDVDLQSKQNDLCGAYSRAYLCQCDLYSSNIYHEVGWDVNLIYSMHNLRDFSLNDFDYVTPKDLLALISALKYNQWFETLNCEDIKLANDLQDEIIRVLSMSHSKIKTLSLQHCSLKSDFIQKLKNNVKFKHINLSRNSIEDRGALALSHLLRDGHLTLEYLSLSKCSLYPKGINYICSSLRDYSACLTHLDLSFNSLKDDPIDLFKYLSETNTLQELNLTASDIDLERLFHALNKGCLCTLQRLILASNTNHSKSINVDFINTFFQQSNALNSIDLSNCKLTGAFVQNIFSGLQLNENLINIHLNLSSNDLGSCLKTFTNYIGHLRCLTSLDLSDNNFENEFDYFLNELRQSSIKHLWLAKNFVNIKVKHLKPIINSLVKLITKQSKIESLWLTDCKLKTHLNDLLSVLGACNTLKLLDISGNEISDFGLNLLSKSLQVNCSIQNLSFDRSNVSYLAYNHLFDALKRNFTLKSIQIPIIDICNIYQKSPDKITDIVKQMNELMSSRNSNMKKLSMEQIFKTKMRLMSETSKYDESHRMLGDNSLAIETKDVVQNLSETVIDHFSGENAIESKFSDVTSKLVQKLDSLTIDLEAKLNATLKKVYPKYNSIKIDNLLDGNTTYANLKKLIKDSMNSLFVQIHNEFCEIAYQMSTSMAEKLIQSENTLDKESQQISKTKPLPLQPVVDKNELQRFNFKSTSVRNNSFNESQQVVSRLDINSKTRRPISTQIHQSIIQQEPQKDEIEENIYTDIKDDIDSDDSKSRDKTPEKRLDTTKNNLIKELRGNMNNSHKKEEEIDAPRPAPRSALRKRGPLVAKPIDQPKLETHACKDSTSSSLNTSADDLISDDTLENKEKGNLLNHMNKNRAKRPNIKKPTNIKAQISIETHEVSEELRVNENETIKSKSTEAIQAAPSLISEQIKAPPRDKIQPKSVALVANTEQQPVVSQNILENVKLRKTNVAKNQAIETINDLMTQSQSTNTNTHTSNTTAQVSSSSPVGLSRFGRHSCYVSSTRTSPLTSAKENLDEVNNLNRPPLKPPRTTVVAPQSNQTSQDNLLQIKLKPVKRDTLLQENKESEIQENKLSNELGEKKKQSVRERIQMLSEESKKTDSNF